MNKIVKGLMTFAFLVSAGALEATTVNCGKCCVEETCCETVCGGHPFFSIRSQSINAARDLVGWQMMINKFDADGFHGAFSITPEYTRSFRPCRIAGFFFGDDIQNGVLTISGSRKGTTRVAGDPEARDNTSAVKRGEHEWLADYFGLPTNFESRVKFIPRISNFLVDLGLYIGLDEGWEGGFFKIHAPLVYTKWELNMCESAITESTFDYFRGYMDSIGIDRSEMPKDFTAAMKGVTWGDMQEALKYGKIADCGARSQTKVRLSDIEVALGWNFVRDEDYHFGLMVRASFPTGNKPTAEYLFEPIVGSGGHWMLGAGMTAHMNLWRREDMDSAIDIYVDTNVGHYFKTKQWRSFDLKDKKNSRYMLIQEMGTPVENLYAGTDYDENKIPAYQYQERLFPLINKTTCCTDVSIAMQGDFAIKVAYYCEGFSLDVGYNLWGRSGEKFNEDCCTDCCLAESKYALKGDTFVIGFVAADADADGVGTPSPLRNAPVPLSGTQSEATINSGKNTPSGELFVPAHYANPGVDNKQLAWLDNNVNEKNTIMDDHNLDHDEDYHTNTSLEPKLLSCDDINMCKTPSALSHKIFFNMSYAWDGNKEKDDWIPFFGIGGEIEFSGESDDTYSAVSQWGIWIKGGMSFD